MPQRPAGAAITGTSASRTISTFFSAIVIIVPTRRRRGLTEIRGPYYTAVGRRYLADLLEIMGAYVDTLKYAGGSFSLMLRSSRS